MSGVRRWIRGAAVAVVAAVALVAIAVAAQEPSPAPVLPGEHPEQKSPPSRTVPAGAKPTPVAGMCGVCHSEVRVRYERGVHSREAIGCTSCHGGNAAAISVPAAHAGNYRGVPSRRAIPAL
jgi:hypothetical protein